MTALRYVAIVLVALLAIGWLGFQIPPAPFTPYQASGSNSEPATIPLPSDLPSPVRRYYEALYGDQVPVVESVVLSGRARLRMNGLAFRARFRFIHQAGEGYRHYIEGTWFGIPVLVVNEHFVDGRARMELPFGVTEDEPKVDQAANLALWGEAIWFPTLWLTDPRVRWEPIDDTHARLIVPFGKESDSLVFAFDPQTNLLLTEEAMRYREVTGAKIRWLNTVLDWESFAGTRLPSPASVHWMDQAKPWAVFTVKEAVYNTDVSEYIRAFGL